MTDYGNGRVALRRGVAVDPRRTPQAAWGKALAFFQAVLEQCQYSRAAEVEAALAGLGSFVVRLLLLRELAGVALSCPAFAVELAFHSGGVEPADHLDLPLVLAAAADDTTFVFTLVLRSDTVLA